MLSAPVCSVRLTRPCSRAQPSAASMSALPIPRLAARSATASSPMYPSRSPVKCRLGLTLMTPAIASPSAATKTVPSPAAAAASESASHRRPASRATAWSRHGATPSASLGASAKIASLSAPDAGRMLMPELSMPLASHADPPLKKRDPAASQMHLGTESHTLLAVISVWAYISVPKSGDHGVTTGHGCRPRRGTGRWDRRRGEAPGRQLRPRPRLGRRRWRRRPG